MFDNRSLTALFRLTTSHHRYRPTSSPTTRIIRCVSKYMGDLLFKNLACCSIFNCSFCCFAESCRCLLKHFDKLKTFNNKLQMMFRGGRGGRWGRGGGRWGRGGFQPRPPPPESEETVFKKYDTTPSTPHPSQSHPISKLCEMVRSKGWPQPEWDLCEEKVSKIDLNYFPQ